MSAFILGNGISRKGISAAVLRHHGMIYGCNALYRDFTPDVLVATDTPIAKSIQESGYANTHRFYTRKPILGSGAIKLPDKYIRASSGPNALYLALLDKHLDIYLLGFDMGPAQNDRINNVYAGTDFYRDKNSPPTSPDKWIADLTKIIREHKYVKFTRVLGIGSASIPDIHNLQNVSAITISEFLAKFG